MRGGHRAGASPRSTPQPRPHKGPLRLAPFLTHQTEERGEGVGRWGKGRASRARNLVARPGGSWEFWTTKAGVRDSRAAHGAEVKGTRDPLLMSGRWTTGSRVLDWDVGLLGPSLAPLPAHWAVQHTAFPQGLSFSTSQVSQSKEIYRILQVLGP